MKRLVILLLLGFASVLEQSARASDAPGYHLIKQVPLGTAPGAEYFDYVTVDSPARRVYLTHGSEVKVVDADTFAVVGTLSGFKRCHGVLILPQMNKGFVTDGDAGEVVIFDPKTLQIRGRITGVAGADSIIYDPASKLIFTFNGGSKNASAIDPEKENIVKQIDLDGHPEYPVADGKGMVYDNLEDVNVVAAIDTHALTVQARWPVAPAGTPVGMAMDREHRRVFSAGRGPQFLVMIDADSGKVLQSLPISGGVDANVFEPKSQLLFVSTRDGKIHIYHEDSPQKLSEVETVDTQYGAKTMNIDPKTHNLFLTTADFGPAPPATKDQPEPSRPAVHGTGRLLVYGR